MNRRRFIQQIGISTAAATMLPELLVAGNHTRGIAAEKLQRYALFCQGVENPLGIDDPSPVLSWIVQNASRGAAQTAYRVRVASSSEMLTAEHGNFWDTGKVMSDQSVNVMYSGKPLASGQRCFWQVRTWDQHGRASPWSPIAWWEMAAMKPEFWQARWISSAEMKKALPPVHVDGWYWLAGQSGGTAYFRTIVAWPEQLAPWLTNLYMTADASYTVYLNGKKLGVGKNPGKMDVFSQIWDPRLNPGKNVIAVKVQGGTSRSGLAAGLVAVKYGGEDQSIPLTQWRCSRVPAKGWYNVDFDDRNWLVPEQIAKFDSAPFGSVDMQLDGPRRSFILRKEFDLSSNVKRARAYVTGLGGYDLYINGTRVSEDLFKPAWTQYQKRLEYQTLDVTNLLKPGRNAIGAVIGNSWWSSGMGLHDVDRWAKADENLRFLCQLEIQTENAPPRRVISDSSWKTHFSPILLDSVYMGETYDARLEQSGWNQPEFDDRSWQSADIVEAINPAKLCAQRGPSVQITHRLMPTAITEPKPGVYVVNFGQNHAGVTELRVKAPAGTRIEIRHAELLNTDGTVYTENLRSAKATDVYICKGGGWEQWSPRFTYHGYQYIQITGLPFRPNKTNFTALVFHSAPDTSGHFECGNPLLNRIWLNILWGQRSNLMTVSTDCPQRDERWGWMGDGEVFSPMACWNMQMANFYAKWLRDMSDTMTPQGPECLAPCYHPVRPGTPAWSDAMTVVPWRNYVYNADLQTLRRHYHNMKQWVDIINANLTAGLFIRWTYGDWVAVVRTPTAPISAAYGILSTRIVAKTARILGQTADAEKYDAAVTHMIQVFNKKFLNRKTMNYAIGTQCDNALPLAFDIAPPEDRAVVAGNIAADVRRRGGHLSTGFVASAVLPGVLADNGFIKEAYAIINTMAYPSLGYMIKKGATTVWELWNSDKQGPLMNSRNHFALGGMGIWLYEGLVGVRPDENMPGFKHFFVRPQIPDRLAWAKLSKMTPYGLLKCDWRKRGNTLIVELLVPVNTSATVELPIARMAEGTITEGDTTLMRRGQCVSAAGFTFIRIGGGNAVWRIPAGTYKFVVAPA